MYQGHTILAVIPARKGSKRLPGKNMKLFRGLPMVEWTMIAAARSEYLDEVVVSSDIPETIELARKHRVRWSRRNSDLARDNSSSEEVCIDVVEKPYFIEFPDGHKDGVEGQLYFDLVMLLQPTSPLRNSADIDHAIELFFKPVDRVISFGYNTDPTVLQPSGAIYLLRTHNLLRGAPFYSPDGARIQLTPPERFADIDTQDQFDEAETKNARHGCEPSS